MYDMAIATFLLASVSFEIGTSVGDLILLQVYGNSFLCYYNYHLIQRKGQKSQINGEFKKEKFNSSRKSNPNGKPS